MVEKLNEFGSLESYRSLTFLKFDLSKQVTEMCFVSQRNSEYLENFIDAAF